jgi:hypothetical protein
MEWIEIIELRSGGSNRDLLESQLRSIITELEDDPGKPEIKIYCCTLVGTDYNIIISHDSMKVEAGGSRLGLRLTEALKVFGLVNHSIWNEINKK